MTKQRGTDPCPKVASIHPVHILVQLVNTEFTKLALFHITPAHSTWFFVCFWLLKMPNLQSTALTSLHRVNCCYSGLSVEIIYSRKPSLVSKFGLYAPPPCSMSTCIKSTITPIPLPDKSSPYNPKRAITILLSTISSVSGIVFNI